jgi:hypothetical protein
MERMANDFTDYMRDVHDFDAKQVAAGIETAAKQYPDVKWHEGPQPGTRRHGETLAPADNLANRAYFLPDMQGSRAHGRAATACATGLVAKC